MGEINKTKQSTIYNIRNFVVIFNINKQIA